MLLSPFALPEAAVRPKRQIVGLHEPGPEQLLPRLLRLPRLERGHAAELDGGGGASGGVWATRMICVEGNGKEERPEACNIISLLSQLVVNGVEGFVTGVKYIVLGSGFLPEICEMFDDGALLLPRRSSLWRVELAQEELPALAEASKRPADTKQLRDRVGTEGN